MIPLNVHSNYSLLRGAFTVDQLIDKTVDMNLNAVSLTDTNGMYGLIQFAKKAAEKKLKPVLGTFIDDPNNKNVNAILLARNNSGYSELCKIVTSRKLRDDFSLIELLKNNLPNLNIVTSSFELLNNLENNVNVYAELIATKKQKQNTRKLFEFAKEKNIKYAASSPVYFLKKEDYKIHKILTAINLNKNFDDLTEDELVDEEFYFKPANELEKVWAKFPEAVKNVHDIVADCNVDLKFNEYKYPAFNNFSSREADNILREITTKGLYRIYKKPDDKIFERLNYELSVISELNFSNYFLIVDDIVKEAKRRGMMLIGRGSAANSLVAYCLGLTQVDPIKYNFYFERFLNKGRSNPPDVDIDFSWKERDEIVKYVFEKYGYENVAMISTHVTFRARSAFREVAKAFGFSNEEISKYSKFIPWTNAQNLSNLSELFPESRKLNFKVEPWKSIVKLAEKLAGFPRHLSIHPSGIVITPKPINNYVALEYAKNKGLGLIITQPDMYSIEDLGLIKIDLLSQRSLGVLRDTMEMINNNDKKEI